MRRCNGILEKISRGAAPLKRRARSFFWSVRRCSHTIEKESGGNRTMHWDFTPLQRYPHDCKLKRSTPQPYHALRFHASPKVPTQLQVEEEHTTIAPCIKNQPYHSFEERFSTHLHVKEIHSHGCHLEKRIVHTSIEPPWKVLSALTPCYN